MVCRLKTENDGKCILNDTDMKCTFKTSLVHLENGELTFLGPSDHMSKKSLSTISFDLRTSSSSCVFPFFCFLVQPANSFASPQTKRLPVTDLKVGDTVVIPEYGGVTLNFENEDGGRAVGFWSSKDFNEGKKKQNLAFRVLRLVFLPVP